MNFYQSLRGNVPNHNVLGSKETSVTAVSIIPKSFEFKHFRALMEEQFSQMGEDKYTSVIQQKQNMGKFKYDLLHNKFNLLSSGGPLQKYNYMFHIDAIKFFSLIQHIQENLQLKDGRLRNVVMSGQKFKNIPLYECTCKGIRSLFK